VSSDYLNRNDVQAALHVGVANVHTWGPCGNGAKDLQSSALLKQHRLSMSQQNLMAPNNALGDLYKKILITLPVLIYSGDVDQCVPYYYSDNWVRDLAYPVNTPWRPWTYGPSSNIQVGGYTMSYQAANVLTFLTVRNSGHMVPQYQPVAALTMFTRYLAGGPYE